MDLVVSDVKLSVFYGMSPIADDQIRQVIAKWATVHAVGLLIGQPSAGSPAPAAGTPRANTESELVDAVKKAIAAVNDGVTFGKKGANVNIGVTGLTAILRRAITPPRWPFLDGHVEARCRVGTLPLLGKAVQR